MELENRAVQLNDDECKTIQLVANEIVNSETQMPSSVREDMVSVVKKVKQSGRVVFTHNEFVTIARFMHSHQKLEHVRGNKEQEEKLFYLDEKFWNTLSENFGGIF